jgi:thiamine pyrophosphate-dependent acetolactate synthase large subunit-like protein
VQRLREHGVRHVFGYPGGQVTPIYDALYREPAIRHVLARDEQAASFMADGYARATGRPGVCLAVCGPGVLNAATPIATAFTDSTPVLLLSGQVASAGAHPRSGYYHENDQLSAVATFTKWRGRIEDAAHIEARVDEAFRAMTEGRPGPALLEVPVDVLRAPRVDRPSFPVPPRPTPAVPDPAEVETLARLLTSWRRPLLLVGGGVLAAGAERLLIQLAERLGTPVFHTLMGKSAFPADHPLAAFLPWQRATSDLSRMESNFSPLFSQADGLLAIGCRFTQVVTGSWTMPVPPSLAQIDIDAAEIGRHFPVQAGVCGDARETLRLLLDRLPAGRQPPWATAGPPPEAWPLPGIDALGAIRRALPRNAIIAADVTRLGYALLAGFPVYEPRTFLHPAGFVPMGFGIPAAVAAKAAFPERTVVAVVGDGCFLMSGMELATVVQEGLPVIVLLVNDSSLTLIKEIQQRRYEGRYLGVDLRNPDFGLFARAFGVPYRRADSGASLESALREAIASAGPALIEIQPGH